MWAPRGEMRELAGARLSDTRQEEEEEEVEEASAAASPPGDGYHASVLHTSKAYFKLMIIFARRNAVS